MPAISTVRLTLIATICFIAQQSNGQMLNPPTLVCAGNESTGDVQLTWIPPNNPCGPFVGYEIWASNSFSGPYNLLTTVATETDSEWLHVGASGITTTWYYYMVPVYNCPGFSAPTSDTLDNLDPEPPAIDYLTVIPTGIEINWLPSTSPEAWAYVIYRQVAGFTPVDTVYGRLNTSYIDMTGEPGNQLEVYTIATMDSCNSLGLFSEPAHNSIHLSESLDGCGDLELTWNAYGLWASGVEEYEILAGVDGSAPVVVDAVANNVFTYFLDVDDGTDVCVTVQAVREDGIRSVSNEICLRISKVQPSDFVFMRNATMLTSDSALIQWYVDPAATLEDYKLERGIEATVLTTIELQNYPLAPPPFLEYLDEPIPAGRFYRAVSVDSCGDEVGSQTVRTIKLSGEAGFNLTNNLRWNDPMIERANITNWNIYRFAAGAWSLIGMTAPSTTEYNDVISNELDGDGIFCYRVEAEFDLDIPEIGVFESLVASSDELCLDAVGKVYVPNAIVPGGSNPVFRPVLVFGQANSYSLEIVNRSGGVIFRSENIGFGWDGTFEGQAVPGGAYGYIIRFRTNDGRNIIKRGNVVVVR